MTATATERSQLLPLSPRLSPPCCTFLLQQPGTVQKAFCPRALREFAFTWRSERDPNPQSKQEVQCSLPPLPLCPLLYPFVRRSIDFQLQNKHKTVGNKTKKKTKAKENENEKKRSWIYFKFLSCLCCCCCCWVYDMICWFPSACIYIAFDWHAHVARSIDLYVCVCVGSGRALAPTKCLLCNVFLVRSCTKSDLRIQIC